MIRCLSRAWSAVLMFVLGCLPAHCRHVDGDPAYTCGLPSAEIEAAKAMEEGR